MTEKSETLYKLMVHKGYPEEFSRLISAEMDTDFMAERMIHYIGNHDMHPLEEVADEMLSIKAFRDKLIEEHQAEYAQQKINEMYRGDFFGDTDEDTDTYNDSDDNGGDGDGADEEES